MFLNELQVAASSVSMNENCGLLRQFEPAAHQDGWVCSTEPPAISGIIIVKISGNYLVNIRLLSCLEVLGQAN